MGRFKPWGVGGLLFDSPGSEMSRSLPLSSRSALGEERAFKNSITGLNISAPRLLQVISNYSADKRLLAQGAWHPRCHSRGTGHCGPPAPSSPSGHPRTWKKGTERPWPSPGHNSDMSSYLAGYGFLEPHPHPSCSHWVHSPACLTHA